MLCRLNYECINRTFYDAGANHVPNQSLSAVQSYVTMHQNQYSANDNHVTLQSAKALVTYPDVSSFSEFTRTIFDRYSHRT